MYYSVIGILALLILMIENQDIFLNRNKISEIPVWKVYRRFLFSVLAYYFTDIIWGILEYYKMAKPLFADTSIYFLTMAAGILFWTQYVITYLEEKNKFAKFYLYAGRILALAVSVLTVLNIFIPLTFTVDDECVYRALPLRYVLLLAQIVLLVMLSGNSHITIHRRKITGIKIQRNRIISNFSLLMAFFLAIQLWFTYLPMYSIAYLLGTCLLRAVVIASEKEEYRAELADAEKIKTLKQSISALLDNMPALTFSKDAETGIYLACNQSFAEYAHKDDPEGVIGLTDAQIFDAETAKHFVEDDRMALSMDEPYIFFEDVPDAAGNQRQFQTTKLKYIDSAGRLCTLGMCQDVTDLVRIQRENALTKEAYEKSKNSEIILTHITQTLAHGYADLFYVNIENGDFIEYRNDNESGTLVEARRGKAFFESCKREALQYVYRDDVEEFLNNINKDNLVEQLEKNKIFNMTYRIITKKGNMFVNMKITRMEDDEDYIIIGISDIDEEMKRRHAEERINEERIVYNRLQALVGDFLCVYTVEPDTGKFREFSATDGLNCLDLPREGDDFFGKSAEQIKKMIYRDDLKRFNDIFTKERVLSDVRKNGIFAMNNRLVIDGNPRYVQLKAAMVEESEGARLIVGISDIDALIRQEEDYEKRLSLAQTKANIDALTGVKTKHAYLDEEDKLNKRIIDGKDPKFAIVILDVNDLKKINDSEGHQAGDQYIKNACKLICNTFKRSPVFRVGGDEFTVVVQGVDYSKIDDLIDRITRHNLEATQNGGIVVACGMSKYENDKSVSAVFYRADQKMYENKNMLKSMSGNHANSYGADDTHDDNDR